MPIVKLHRKNPLDDGRQSELALFVRRGIQILSLQLGLSLLTEVALPNGRRADLMGFNRQGEIWIIEIKSSLADLKADHKWPDYSAFCDRLFFASHGEVALEHFPESCGFMLADAFGAHIVREAPLNKLSAQRRKALMLRIAKKATARLTRAELHGFVTPQDVDEDDD